MRLWPVVVRSACLVVLLAGCGGSGSRAAFFDAGQADAPAINDDAGIILTTPEGGVASGCVPKTCADLGANCGPQGDGCGGLIDGGCGSCPANESCGGGGKASKCGASCVPKTCADQGIECGPAGDLCGGTLNCNPGDAGACPDGGVCGGGGLFKCGPASNLDAGVGDAGACVPKSCQPNQCGPTNDGCGHALSCPACGDGGTCGYPIAFFCGYPDDAGVYAGVCVPRTCADQSIGCGLAGDGCGNVINCWPDAGAGADGGSCPDGGVCGAGGPSQCGAAPPADAASACTPSNTCAGMNCGFIDDGCGHLLDCWPDGGSPDSGASCSGFNSCGGGGVANVCGGSPAPPDGGSLCVPLTCAAQKVTCGSAGDGCGNTINCYPDGGTSCGPGMECDAVDGGSVGCVPISVACTKTTCAAQHIACGTAGDGCGGTLNCYPGDASSCAAGSVCETADGGVVECVSQSSGCTPTTCGKLGFNCGFAGDNCGGLLNCNPGDAGCVSPEYCGGGGPNVCGVGFSPSDGGTYVSCSGGTATSITGVAYAATDPTMFDTTVTPDPIAGAYVWVPSDGKLPPIAPGISCEQCTNPPTALAVAITGANGAFTLPNVPVVATTGTITVPLVVQVGRWARLVNVPVTPCTSNTVPQYTARLPRTSSEGNLPWFAFDTGSVDSLECVLLKMGVSSTMFASPATVTSDMNLGGTPKAGGTRVAIYTSPDTYQGGQIGGAFDPGGGDTSGLSLYGSLATMEHYDAILLPCVGAQVTANKSAGDIENVVNYANAGGRVFATHYSYVWLYDDYPISGSAAADAWGCGNGCSTAGKTVGQWQVEQAQWNSVTANINTATTDGRTFAQWMVDVKAATITSGAGAGGTVVAGSTVQFTIDEARWDLNSVNSTAEEWAYYDPGAGETSVQQMTFNTPVNGASASQCGRVVFSDFHVTNNSEYGDSFPTECTDNGKATVTGHLPDFTPQEKALEFMIFDLASCVSPNLPTGTCVPKTCSSYPAGTCGQQSDGCGGILTCSCPSGESCGTGGTPGICGPACTKRSCAFYGSATCGTQSDGCGGTISCPGCDGGTTCGGGGVADQCGACVPKTCSSFPAGTCGQQADGCGGLTANCEICPAPETCGGGGTPNVCGKPDAAVCTPRTCSAYATGTCGPQSDGCGNVIECGSCSTGQACGAGGFSLCGAIDADTCKPIDCTAVAPGTCGEQADGCGGLTSYCNPCTAPATCGGAGVPSTCGAGSCVPSTCAAQGIACGPAGDGCGGALSCGSCAKGQVCGGGGTPGVCGSCVPLTCSSPGVGCGVNGDGCGGELDCSCPTGQTCGGGGIAGQCGTACVPATCTGLGLQCGYEADGCGNLLDCGTCSSGTCVGGGCVQGAPQ